MKVFRLNTYMQLPREFEGTYEEAVGRWLELRDRKMRIPETPSVSIRVANEAFFLNLRYGFSVVAETGIWSLEGKCWVRKDSNPSSCYGSGDTWIK